MPPAIRPRRSVLYMPGSNARALEKSQGLDADAYVFDLEDAVAPDAKAAARAQLADVLPRLDHRGRERAIRVNGLATPWGLADLEMAAKAPVDGVVIPKVESADMLRQAERVLDAAGAPAGLMLWAMMETPRAFLRVDEIAGAGPRLAGLVMGTSDLTQELRASHTPDRAPLMPALGIGVLAARAHGLAILDGVHLDLSDDDGLAASCRQAAAMGFDGKTLIHPKTIAAANIAFSPAAERLRWADRVLDAHAAATAAGQGVVVLDGRLIENLHVVEATRLKALATAIAALA
ncbi:MAG: CoA ester lyase [Alphaproteobacteria bacterium]